MSERLKQLIISELSSLNYHPQGDKRIKIHCPFHHDTNPSLIIPINHTKYKPGQFKCFSCGAKGNWNDLANRLMLRKWDEYDTNKYYDNAKKEFAEDDAFRDLLPTINGMASGTAAKKVEGLEELPADFTWRGLNRDFWISMGCSYYWDRRRDQFYIHMPMLMNGNYMGYTLAALPPIVDKVPKYQTFAPTDSVILLYDLIKPNSTILLVEGHFDAWRMRALGFEVGGMIGTENWSSKKTAAILAKCPKRVIICTDGDEPGYKAGEMLNRTMFDNGIDTIYYKLPYYPKPDSLDPGNMSLEYVEDMRRYVI